MDSQREEPSVSLLAEEAPSTPHAGTNDGANARYELDIESPLCLPAELYGVIAEYLILKSAFGTCANLDIANKAAHFHVKPVLWRLVSVKCQQDALPTGSADSTRKEMMKVGNDYIRHIVELPPKGEWLDRRLALDTYRALAPKASTLVSVIHDEDHVAFDEEWTILIASLMPETQLNSGDLLDVGQVLTMLSALLQSCQPPRINDSLTISIPLSKLLLPVPEERAAAIRVPTDSGYPPIRRISVENQSVETPSFETYLALFRDLRPLFKDQPEGNQYDLRWLARREVRIEAKEDDMAELDAILKAWSAFVLEHRYLADVDLEIQLRQTSTLILTLEDDTDAHLRGLFAPLLGSSAMLGLWGDASQIRIGAIFFNTPEASAGLHFRKSVECREITLQYDVGDYMYSSESGGNSGLCRVLWNTSEMVNIHGWP